MRKWQNMKKKIKAHHEFYTKLTNALFRWRYKWTDYSGGDPGSERSRKPGDVDGRPLYRVPSGSGVRYFLGQPEQLVTKKTTTKSHHCKSICTLSRGLSWIMNWNIKNAQTASDVPFIFYAVESSNKAQTQFAEIVGNGKTYETGILF